MNQGILINKIYLIIKFAFTNLLKILINFFFFLKKSIGKFTYSLKIKFVHNVLNVSTFIYLFI